MSEGTVMPEQILAWAETRLAPDGGCQVSIGWLTLVRNTIGQVSIWTEWDKATPQLVFVADPGGPSPVIRVYLPGPWVGQLAAISGSATTPSGGKDKG